MMRIIVVAMIGIVLLDTLVVYIANDHGMRYPFMAAAIANLCLVLATHIIGITWMLTR